MASDNKINELLGTKPKGGSPIECPSCQKPKIICSCGGCGGGGDGDESEHDDALDNASATSANEQSKPENEGEQLFTLTITDPENPTANAVAENQVQLTLKEGVSFQNILDELNTYMKQLAKEQGLPEGLDAQALEKALGITTQLAGNSLQITFSKPEHLQGFVNHLVDEQLVEAPEQQQQSSYESPTPLSTKLAPPGFPE